MTYDQICARWREKGENLSFVNQEELRERWERLDKTPQALNGTPVLTLNTEEIAAFRTAQPEEAEHLKGLEFAELELVEVVDDQGLNGEEDPEWTDSRVLIARGKLENGKQLEKAAIVSFRGTQSATN